MGKKILILFSLIVLFSSCFIKLDEKDTNNKSTLKINLSNVSREYIETSIEKITVSLINLSDGREYLAEGTRESRVKKDMVIENIPYGDYNVTIKIYEAGASEPYSIISNKLTVGKDISSVEGVIGAPNDISNLTGILEYYANQEGYYYLSFECDKITSNLVADTTGDDIVYKLYGSANSDFGNPKLLVTVDSSDNRHPKNTGKSKVIFKKGKFSLSDSEMPETIDIEKTYYWKIIVSNLTGSNESEIQLVTTTKNIVNNLPSKISVESALPRSSVYSQPSEFSWKAVESISNNNDYNSMSYILYISTDNFASSTSTQIIKDYTITEDGRVVVTTTNSSLYKSLVDSLYFEKEDTRFYWKVEAINEAGSTMSDTFEFIYIPLPNKVDSTFVSPTLNNPEFWNAQYDGFEWKGADKATSYKLHISKDNSFPENENTVTISPQESDDPNNGWISGDYVSVSYYTSAEYIDLIDNNIPYFVYNTTYYWKVEAINSNGSTMSDIFEIYYKEQP